MSAGLPTWQVIVNASLTHLDQARSELSSVRDWLASDWSPVGSSLTIEAGEARREVQRLVGEAKAKIDEAKGYLSGDRADRTELLDPYGPGSDHDDDGNWRAGPPVNR